MVVWVSTARKWDKQFVKHRSSLTGICLGVEGVGREGEREGATAYGHDGQCVNCHVY